MPFLSHITSTFFTSLINRLGVRPPPPDGFDLINTVQPVSIVDADIALAAVTTSQLLDIPLTAGPTAVPGAGVVLADSGALPAGNYLIQVFMSAYEGAAAAVPSLEIQRRDAANAATIWGQRFYLSSSAAGVQVLVLGLSIRVTLQINERIRVINTIAGGVGSEAHANLWVLAS